MLAYVFWHWPATGIAPAEYERMQRGFHQALAEAGVAGFRSSTSFRLDGQAPWLGGSPAYADWYLVDGSAVLDPLNEAAVSGARWALEAKVPVLAPSEPLVLGRRNA